MKTPQDKNLIQQIRNQVPLVHSITNMVTVNFVANALLAFGASPVMAEDLREVKEITSIAKALLLNMGTLHPASIEAMIKSGKTANERGIPVVFDAVGAGASALRTKVAKELISTVKIAAIHGNASEIASLYLDSTGTKGVDVSDEDEKRDLLHLAKSFAKKENTYVVLSGKTDYVTDGDKTYAIRNGHPMMSKITGTGCALSGLLAAALACSHSLESCKIATLAMGISGQWAYNKSGHLGTGSFSVSLLDHLSKITDDIIEKEGNYEEV